MVTRHKTITVDEEHIYIIQKLGLNASKLFRAAMNEYIHDDDAAKKALAEYERIVEEEDRQKKAQFIEDMRRIADRGHFVELRL